MYLENVQMQVHPKDCGVYAIAFLTDLCFDKDPTTCCYDHRVMRSHLIKCFEAGQMTPFPSTATRKKNSVPKQLNVYFHCRLPNASEHISKLVEEPSYTMVKCYICENLYHCSCVNVTEKQAKKINSSEEMWFCEYKGCEESFGYLFDSNSDSD